MTKELLDKIKTRHLHPEHWKGKTFYNGHIMVDLNLLVEEVERMKALYESDDDERKMIWEQT